MLKVVDIGTTYQRSKVRVDKNKSVGMPLQPRPDPLALTSKKVLFYKHDSN